MGQVNIRVPDGKVVELRERLKAVADGLGVSQAEAVERGLERLVVRREAVSDGDISRWFRETWKRLEDLPREILEAADAKRAQRSSVARTPRVEEKPVSTTEQFPFFPKCDHCGENFGAWNRNAGLCSECKGSRHIGEPRDCPVCTSAGTGAI